MKMYKLEVWNTAGGGVIENTIIQPWETSRLVNVPMDGTSISARLSSDLGSGFIPDADRQYTAVSALNATLTTLNPPASNIAGVSPPMLSSDTVTFHWSPGVAVTQYSFDYTWQNNPLVSAVTNGTSATISGLPHLAGVDLVIRLGSLIGQQWVYVYYNNNYQLWNGNYLSVLKAPAQGVSIDLSVSPTTFTWSQTAAATGYLLKGSSQASGGNNLFNKTVSAAGYQPGQDISTTASISAPAGTGQLYVELVPQGAAYYTPIDYTYTLVNVSTKAVLLTPASPILSGPTTFTWSAGAGVVAYRLQIKKAWDSTNTWFFDTTIQAPATTSTQIAIPSDGTPVVVRLSSLINGVWQADTDHPYTTPTGGPRAIIYNPIPLSTLGGTSVTFWWGGASSQTATNTVTYTLQVGTSAGNGFYFNQTVTGTHQTVTGLPSNGGTIYVRLITTYSQATSNTGNIVDYTYTAYNAASDQSGIVLGSSYQQTSAGNYLVTVTAGLQGADATKISRMELFLENAIGSAVQGFACHVLLYPNQGGNALFLADDLGDLGPSPSDRYMNGRSMMPGNVQQASPPINWPNNSQCTLSEQGSRIDYLGSDTIQATFNIAMKPHIKGDFAVKAMAEWCPTGQPCLQSPLLSMDPLPSLDPVDQQVDILRIGFESKGSSFRLDTGAGDRENFAFRFSHRNGAQQLKFVYINISPSDVPNAGDASSCQITVSPLTGMVQLAGSQYPTGANVTVITNILQNSQCIVHLGRDSEIKFLSATEVLVRLNVEFKLPWDGSRLYFHRAADGGLGINAWQNTGGFSYGARLQKVNEPGAEVIPVTTVSGLNGCVSTATMSAGQMVPRVCLLQAPGITLGNNKNQDGTFVYETIEIRRSNVTIRGHSKYTTAIRRVQANPPYPYPLIKVAMTEAGNDHPPAIGPFTGIIISDLTIDGGRLGYETTEPVVATDVILANVGSPNSINALPLNNGEGVRIENCRFLNAPSGAIVASPPIDWDNTYALSNWNDHPTRGVLIQNNEFIRSFRAPIVTSLNGTWWPGQPGIPDYLLKAGDPNYPRNYKAVNPADVHIIVQGKCDAEQKTSPIETTINLANISNPASCQVSPVPPTCKKVHTYDGLPYYTPDSFIIQNNFFEENDTGAFGIDSVTNFKILNNAFLNNYNNGWDCGGGVIAVGHCANHTTIENNFLWNKEVYTYPQMCLNRISGGPQTNTNDKYALSSGLELWGKDFTIRGNWIEYFPTEGISLGAVDTAYVTNNMIRNTSRGTQDASDPNNPNDRTTSYEDDRPGIQVFNCGMYEPQAYRPLLNINIGKDANGSTSPNEIGNVTGFYLQCTNQNSLGCLQTIYQSYGVRLRQAACGGSKEAENLPGSAYPLDDRMTNVSILYDSSNPLNKNRQGFVCKSSSVTLSGSVIVGDCVSALTIGTPANAGTCGTAGCPY